MVISPRSRANPFAWKLNTNVGATTFGVMDQLTYTYQTNSNKLTIVSDAGNDTFGFKDDQTGTGTDTTIDYTYDVNGNLTTDSNKAITNISYNHLNLPVCNQQINLQTFWQN